MKLLNALFKKKEDFKEKVSDKAASIKIKKKNLSARKGSLIYNQSEH
ncbi:hypothetical protein [Paenisporosarcina indica]|nr:hypothetical protein [Paenisporosarcina indica]